MILLFVIMFSLFASANSESCVVSLSTQTYQTDEEILRQWAKIGNPNLSQHDSTQFQYIIHMPVPKHKFSHLMEILTQIYGDTIDPNQSISLMDEPDRISELVKVSTSLISNNHGKTFFGRKIGLILKVPPENIVAARAGDMGSGGWIKKSELPEFLNRLRSEFGLPAPKVLDEESRGNEIVIQGTSQNGLKVSVAGILVRIDEKNICQLTSFEKEDLASLRRKLNVPIIFIPKSR